MNTMSKQKETLIVQALKTVVQPINRIFGAAGNELVLTPMIAIILWTNQALEEEEEGEWEGEGEGEGEI